MTAATSAVRTSIAETAEASGWHRSYGPLNDLYKRIEHIITVDWREDGTPADISRYGPAGIERANHPNGVEQAHRWLGESATGGQDGAESDG